MDGEQIICPQCGHECMLNDQTNIEQAQITDAHGTPLQDGDSVTLIKDLKIKGTSAVLKVGTKVKNIRLGEGDHDIDCKIDKVGPMKLKSAFVKKV